MNGVHDMGGMHCFGPIQPEENEPVFHSPWEARAFGMAVTMGLVTAEELDRRTGEIAASEKHWPHHGLNPKPYFY